MKKTSRIIACIMLAAAAVFVWYALHHPESSWPWSNPISFTLYGIYLVIMIVLLIAPFKKKE